MNLLTEEQQQTILEGALDSIKEAVIKEAEDSIKWTVKHEIGSQVGSVVEEFMKSGVRKPLHAFRPGMNHATG